MGFSGELVVKNLPANAGDLRDMGLISGLGRSPAGGNGNRLQCSCLENPRDKGAWWAAIYGVTQSQTRLKQLSSSSSSMIPLPFTLLFWVRVYTPFLCFLSREYPLAFVGELVWWC